MEKIVVLAIPVYFGSLFIEAWWSHRKGKGYFKLKDSLGCLGTGILMQMLEVFTKGILLGAYLYVYSHLSVKSQFGWNLWSNDVATLHGLFSWVFVFLAVDFIYYLFHRHSHEVNFLWAAHMVHHSSEEYNFSVALRQSAFQGIFSSFYTASLAVLGIPPEMVLVSFGINLVYQFFLHTRFVGKLGFLELIFNTPSHHRVHHARQSKYLDRNYAGVFIIWDRLCGTFMDEAEEPRYGVYPRFQSYDPVRANLMPYAELWHYFQEARGKDKLYVLFKGPLWLYENFKKGKNLNIMDNKRPADRIALTFFGLALLFALVVLFVPTLSTIAKTGLIFFVVLFLGLMGRRLDRSPTLESRKGPELAPFS